MLLDLLDLVITQDSRIITGDGSTDTTIHTFTSDNCSDSGTIPTTGQTYSYDFGSGNTATICVAKIYSTYGGGARSSEYSVQYSTDNSSWTTAFNGTMYSNGCGVISGSGSIC